MPSSNGHHKDHHNQSNKQERSLLAHTIFITEFFLSTITCLIINVIQAILYLTLRSWHLTLWRKINRFLQYLVFSHVVALAEWWSNSQVTLFYEDEISEQLFGKENVLGVANHRYELDAIMMMMTTNQVSSIGSAKCFGKKELRFVPIFGWTMFFSESIFLSRDWHKDAQLIGSGLKRLTSYDDPVMIAIMAEGTRFTEEKHEAGVKFAQENAIQPYKYHLVPRIKGFAACVRQIKEKNLPCALYDIQLAFDEKNEEPKTSTILHGIATHGDLHVRRIPIESVPTDDHQIKEYLLEMYRKKDRLMEHHKVNGKFPGKMVKKPRKIGNLLAVLLVQMTLTFPICYFILNYVFFSGIKWLIWLTVILILLVFISIYLIIRSTKISKGSKYGTLQGSHSSSKIDHQRDKLKQK